MTILVVEDDRALNELLAEIFEMQGYRVMQAYNGSEALGVIGSEHPDVVTLDLMLPEMLGQELLRRVKENPATSDVRFIVISAWEHSLADDDRKLAAAVFSKPFDVEKLIHAVEGIAAAA